MTWLLQWLVRLVLFPRWSVLILGSLTVQVVSRSSDSCFYFSGFLSLVHWQWGSISFLGDEKRVLQMRETNELPFSSTCLCLLPSDSLALSCREHRMTPEWADLPLAALSDKANCTNDSDKILALATTTRDSTGLRCSRRSPRADYHTVSFGDRIRGGWKNLCESHTLSLSLIYSVTSSGHETILYRVFTPCC